jgi:hypothetical protein
MEMHNSIDQMFWHNKPPLALLIEEKHTVKSLKRIERLPLGDDTIYRCLLILTGEA